MKRYYLTIGCIALTVAYLMRVNFNSIDIWNLINLALFGIASVLLVIGVILDIKDKKGKKKG
jgi:cytochrome c oxidase assembly factor CtaG